MRAIAAVLVLGAVLAPAPVVAQQRPAPAARANSACRFQLKSVGREGRQVIIGADTNYYAGGGVRLVCSDGSASIASDSQNQIERRWPVMTPAPGFSTGRASA